MLELKKFLAVNLVYIYCFYGLFMSISVYPVLWVNLSLLTNATSVFKEPQTPKITPVFSRFIACETLETTG